ncbi:MAG: cytochrome c [Acidobacteria bacterium]|nr:cytochrome c [Acidobacteriota bacterium]
MRSWAEGALALVILLGLGVALFMFSGESLGEGSTATTAPIIVDPDAAVRGEIIASSTGCLACHTIDGTPGSGPTWRGLAGSSRPLQSGDVVTADDVYLTNSIVDPGSQVVAGFDNNMSPDYGDSLTEQEVIDLVEYIKSLAS